MSQRFKASPSRTGWGTIYKHSVPPGLQLFTPGCGFKSIKQQPFLSFRPARSSLAPRLRQKLRAG